MLPVPRTMLPRMLNIQKAMAPAKITVEYDTAAASAPSRPPMKRNSAGPPSSMPAEKSAPIPAAMTSECTASASATSRRPAPRARAMAEATPPPMPPADMVCMSMIRGKTIETPASASVPSPLTKYASRTLTAVCTARTTTLGAARRKSVEAIGPSSNRWVTAEARASAAPGRRRRGGGGRGGSLQARDLPPTPQESFMRERATQA